MGRRVALREFERDEGFTRAGWVDDGGFAARGEHGADFIVLQTVDKSGLLRVFY